MSTRGYKYGRQGGDDDYDDDNAWGYYGSRAGTLTFQMMMIADDLNC